MLPLLSNHFLRSLLFSVFISNNLKENLNRKICIILAISFLIFFSKNLKRIITVDKNYFNTPWPKYYSHSDDNIYKEPKKIKVGQKNLYMTNGLCFYGLAPCTRFTIEFKAIKNFNYDFFVIK